MLIVDFNGLPSSGKSTVCRCLVEQLKGKGKKTIAIQEYMDTVVRNNRDSVRMFFRGIRALGLKKTGQAVCFGLELLRIGAPHAAYRLFMLVYCYGVYMESRKALDADCLISEQSVIQEIISCYYDKPVRNRKHLKKILAWLKEDYLVVNAILPVEEAVVRIRRRENGNSRLDQMDEEAVSRVLRIQAENFGILRTAIRESGLRFCDIDMNCNPEVNAENVIEAFELGDD